MATNIQPVADYVLVQPEEAETKTKTGLYLTQSAQEKPETAKVVAVGKDVKSVKVGDRILYIDDYKRTKSFKVGNDSYTLVREDLIIATVK